jgi:hypothetical protein
MVFNFDLRGTNLGRNCVRIIGDKETFNYIDAWNKIEDLDFLVESDIYSSVNVPFRRENSCDKHLSKFSRHWSFVE